MIGMIVRRVLFNHFYTTQCFCVIGFVSRGFGGCLYCKRRDGLLTVTAYSQSLSENNAPRNYESTKIRK